MQRIAVVGAAVLAGGRCLVAQRSARMSAPLSWEFPGGKLQPGESPEAALVRELDEELGVRVVVGEWLGRGEAAEASRLIVLDVYAAEIVSGVPEAREHAALRWVDADGLEALGFAAADVPVVQGVAARLRAHAAG